MLRGMVCGVILDEKRPSLKSSMSNVVFAV
jgi:hypothetical protein